MSSFILVSPSNEVIFNFEEMQHLYDYVHLSGLIQLKLTSRDSGGFNVEYNHKGMIKKVNHSYGASYTRLEIVKDVIKHILHYENYKIAKVIGF